MMATHKSDGSASGHFPSAEVLDALRASIDSYLRRTATEDDVCAVLERLADEARANDVRPEAMLRTFKDVWYQVTASDRGNARDRATALGRLVTLCIERYYRDRE